MDTGLTLPITSVLLRLGAATIFGALVGLERERLERAAGLRTHVLVALASAMIMIVSTYGFSDVLAPDRQTVLDPSRVAAQVVSGVGFLGAGVIIFRKNTVRGLTTAASIWSVAGIGLAAGGGLFFVAATGTGLILIVQAVLRPLEHRFFIHHQEHRLILQVPTTSGQLAAIEHAVAAAGIELRGIRLRPSHSTGTDRIELDLGPARQAAAASLLEALRAIHDIHILTYTRGSGARGSLSRQDDDRDADSAGDETI